MKKDLKANIATVLLLEPADLVRTDTASGLLDTADCNGVEIDVIIGALTGVDSTNYLTPVLQECDTTENDDFTAVDVADMLGAFSKVDAATKDSVIQRVGYIGGKRYVRVNLDYTGNGITAGIVGVVGILGYSKEAPMTAPAAVAAT
ncbi:MAG: hypothetical protein AAGU74_08315 [Bacillota bacterium]